MIINKLKLENFKSHKDTQIDFNQGISLILGENGAGKSSILEAISYALFKDTTGKLDENIRKPQNTEDNINQMLVTLEFWHNGTLYQLKRGKKKSKNIAELRYKENDKFHMQSNGDRNVTQDIKKILEMDPKSFLNAVYIRQGEITELIDKTASERKEFITKLLNIDNLEVAWEEIKKIINIYEEQKNINEGKLSQYNTIIENKEELSKNIEENTENIKKVENIKTELEQQLKQLEEDVKKQEEAKNKHDYILNDINQKEKLITTLDEQKMSIINEIEKIHESEKNVKKLEKEIKPLSKLREMKELKTQIDSYEKDLKEINKNITKIKETQQKIKTTEQEYKEYHNLKEKEEELENKLKELEEIDKENTIILTKIDNKKEEKDKLFNSINKTANNANKLFNKTFKGPEDIQKIVNEEKTKNDNSIKIIEKNIHENEKKISSYETSKINTQKSLEELQNTKDKCPICQSEITHEKHEELSKKYKNEIISSENRIEELEYANKQQEEKLIELNDLKEKIKNINIDLLKKQNEDFNNVNKELKELKKSIPEIEKNKEEINHKKQEINENQNTLDKLKNAYDTHQFNINLIRELPEIDSEEKKKDEINNKLRELINKTKEIMKTVRVEDNLNRKIDYLEKQQEKYNQEIGKVQNKESKLKEKEEVNNKINKEHEILINKEEKLKELSFDQEKYIKTNDEYTSCDKKLKEINIEKVTKETSLKKDKEQIIKYEKEIENLDNIRQEQEYVSEYIKLLNKIRDIYSKDGVQKDLRNNVRPQIEKNTMDIFGEFGFEYSEIKLDEDYNITVKSKNEILNLNMLSGGEKIVIALALRLGIAKVITKNRTELLILDEPTIHLDSERRNDLIEIIRKINIVPQMIVVTHDEEMESLSNNIIKISKTNGISSCENY